MGSSETIRRIPVLEHIAYRVRMLEKSVNGVACLQFADHPEGLSMVVRIYLPQAEKEFSYPDVILPLEFCNEFAQNERIDVLFDTIHEALESVQIVSSNYNGLIHH